MRFFDFMGRCHQICPWWKKLIDRIIGRLASPFFDGIKDHNIERVCKHHQKKVLKEWRAGKHEDYFIF
jgi:hypothetical protein